MKSAYAMVLIAVSVPCTGWSIKALAETASRAEIAVCSD